MSEVRQRKGKALSQSGQKHEKRQSPGSTAIQKEDDSPIVTLERSMMKRVVGFELADFTSADRFYRLCHAPVDPSCLAAFRIAFGCLMVFDCVHERGLPHLLERWSDEFEVCRFPLFNFLHPLPAHWMAVMYMMMGVGALGIALGFLYRISCLTFVIPYWYLFMLDKTHWNNHSYLFGLTGTLLLFCDANRYWSIDAWRNPDLSNKSIPAWQYGLFRYQLILVYCIAGLKKLDRDWVEGYSMNQLGLQWVFNPLRNFLTNEQIDKYIVHWGGLVVDLTSGFLLFFDATRWLGTAQSCSFHFLNSRMFNIGQFPYVMLCTTVLFYSYDWPKKIFPQRMNTREPVTHSSRCLTEKEKPSVYHRIFSFFCVFFVAWQGIMPYSHFITQGYNNWTGGLYGYSWDMMIHNWNLQHVKIKFVSKTINDEGFLDPEAFVSLNRWPSHPDMIKQHAVCIAKYLEEDYGIPDAEIYMDIWLSMNKRLKQRMIDPNVDLVKVDWSPFRPASYLLPLLNDLEGWRTQLKQIASDAKKADGIDSFLENPDATFLADFPGMMLENHLDEHLANTRITLLAGEAVLYNPVTFKNETLELNTPVKLGFGTHKIYVTSDVPACYMYLYSNTTKVKIDKQLSILSQQILQDDINEDELQKRAAENATLRELLEIKNKKERQREENKAASNKTFWEENYHKAQETFKIVRNSFLVSYSAIESIVTGESMIDVVERRLSNPKPETGTQ